MQYENVYLSFWMSLSIAHYWKFFIWKDKSNSKIWGGGGGGVKNKFKFWKHYTRLEKRETETIIFITY